MSAEELVWAWKNPEYREGGHPAGEIVLDPYTGDATIEITTTILPLACGVISGA
ncbi:hypothetical protein R8Z50_25820 [Longispora sp. K20-0274]|uniref:hypothetical protein n=1 Tax=Longispora sp. K20-0274 TaxID=3088255 RepID=UPI00399C4731